MRVKHFIKTFDMTIAEHLQENLEDYTLKTDDQLLDAISQFGCGELEFHTADVERLVLEKQYWEKDRNALNKMMTDRVNELEERNH